MSSCRGLQSWSRSRYTGDVCHRLHHMVSAHKESSVMKREHFLEEDHSIKTFFSDNRDRNG